MDTPQRLNVTRVAIMTTEYASAEVLRALAEDHAVPGQRYEFDGTTLWWIPTEQPRWHEIATEGLPGAEMEGDGFFVWRDGCPVAYTDDYARDRHPCFLVKDWMGEPTHWMLCPLPAPPTTERR